MLEGAILLSENKNKIGLLYWTSWIRKQRGVWREGDDSTKKLMPGRRLSCEVPVSMTLRGFERREKKKVEWTDLSDVKAEEETEGGRQRLIVVIALQRKNC